MQQQNLNNNSPAGTSYDRSLVDLERRLFKESLDTTRRIHQQGYDDLIKLRNPPTEVRSPDFKGLFKNTLPLSENGINNLRECEFQDNVCRYLKGSAYQVKATCESGNLEENTNGHYPTTQNSSEPFLRSCDLYQGACFMIDKPSISTRPLKSILRNAVFRPETDINTDYLKSRQVTFESQGALCPTNSIIFNPVSNIRIPGQMEWSSQHCVNDGDLNHFQSVIPTSTNLPYSSHMSNSNNLNDPFKYPYLNVNSYSIPEEKSKTDYVNDPNHHITPYQFCNYNETANRNDDLNNMNCFSPRNPASLTNLLADNVFSRPVDQAQQAYMPHNCQVNHPNLNQQELSNRLTSFSPSNYNVAQCDKPIDYNNATKVNYGIPVDEILLQPRTQQRETIYLGKGQNVPLTKYIHSSHPCYAIPSDTAYFHSDRFELYLDAKLLIPERIRVNIVPEKVELYGCTEYITNDCKSLLEIIRVYDLPVRVNPERTACLLNAEGILFISAAWEKSL